MHSAVALRETEAILWAGRPDPKRLFTFADIFIVPFSLFWVSVGLFTVGAWQVSARPVGFLFLSATGLYLVVGRLLVKAHRNQRTEYVLTNQRAVIVGPRRTHTFDLTSHSPHVETIRLGPHSTYKFTSDDPRTYGKISNRLAENTGLDFMLNPGHDTRFSFFDVRADNQPDAIIRQLVETGALARGVA